MSENSDIVNPECTDGDGPLTGKARSRANLRKWQPGCPSPNPLGRKPRGRFCDVLGEALGEPIDENDVKSKTKLQAIVDTLIAKCIAGDAKCLTIFIQHCDPQRVRAGIKAGTLNVLNVVRSGDVAELRDELASFVGIDLVNILREQRHALPGGEN